MQLGKLLGRVTGALAVTVLAGGTLMAAEPEAVPTAATPIQHVVVIFQENVSFDHYFGTYPTAGNKDGNPFTASADTPTVNGFTPGITGNMGQNNPNWNGSFGAPFRLSFSQAATCDQDHDYQAEQQAFDMGMMDMFPTFTNEDCAASTLNGAVLDAGHPKDIVMGYYDGNTVTALWNYAQHFALNDNSYGTTFGPSAPGAINLVSGYTGMAVQDTPESAGIDVTAGSLTNDAQPTGDMCTSRDSAHLNGKNIGNLLNTAGLTWGWFEGGFNLANTGSNGKKGCAAGHSSVTGAFPAKVDYIPHHEPFQFYASTANPTHARPTAAIGTTDAANHQYDSQDFFDALAKGTLPNVVFLKAPGYQDGHAGYSSPIDEQTFVVDTINALEESKFWDSTAVIINWDDSDGWYDHQIAPIIIHSQASATSGMGQTGDADALTGTDMCGTSSNGLQAQGRCGYGPRIPYLVISPWARTNFVDHTLTDQSSTIAFIEKNWGLGATNPATAGDAGSYDQYAGSIMNMFDFTQKKGAVKGHVVYLDPTSGEVVKKKPKGAGDQP
jgi:phospholipase C